MSNQKIFAPCEAAVKTPQADKFNTRCFSLMGLAHRWQQTAQSGSKNWVYHGIPKCKFRIRENADQPSDLSSPCFETTPFSSFLCLPLIFVAQRVISGAPRCLLYKGSKPENPPRQTQDPQCRGQRLRQSCEMGACVVHFSAGSRSKCCAPDGFS